MSCRCNVNTLRSFVKTIAHVDLHISHSLLSTSSQKARAAPVSRNFTSFCPLPPQHRTNSTLTSEAPSSGAQTEPRSDSNSIANCKHDANPKPHDSAKSAVVEVSPEAIDALAVELGLDRQRSILPESRTPARQSSRSHSQKEPSARNERRLEPVFRRTKVQSTSLAQHYSSPPLPVHHRKLAGHRDGRKEATVDDWVPPRKESWQSHKAAMKEKFPDGWNPQKRLSPDAISGIRALHAQDPETYTSAMLAEQFKVSPEAIRRILKSKWQPTADVQINREMRWFRRGERVWSRYAELGLKPPRQWRDEGIGRGKPEWKKHNQIGQGEPGIPELVTTARPDESYTPDPYLDGEPLDELVTTSSSYIPTRYLDEEPLDELVTTSSRVSSVEKPAHVTSRKADGGES
ncbi:hypothetical protein BJ875DRAFT_462976 [Amylocarpus encephaloides]|uniref:Required for respiratory growth protein 9, mitochondrial n=1 Tax=Amylocarpus encephaloides TaxID=45428 RepID=A0A9P7YHB2_9HELO|nr:hypothetical protein BJ875DRAFT_462976 [Amylocarpus encephaloides]